MTAMEGGGGDTAPFPPFPPCSPCHKTTAHQFFNLVASHILLLNSSLSLTFKVDLTDLYVVWTRRPQYPSLQDVSIEVYAIVKDDVSIGVYESF